MRLIALILALLIAAPLNAETLDRTDGKTTRIRVSEQPGKCPPVAILSHGFGGDATTLQRIGRMMHSNGYRVISVAHRESGLQAWLGVLRASNRKEALINAAGDKASFEARFLDLDAAWKFATRRCARPFSVLLGHSMGAQTVMMEAGARARIGRMGRDRFDVYIALSPQGIGRRFSRGAWRSIRKPVLMVTGTRDRGVDGGHETRLTAFDELPRGNKRLAILDRAGHMNVAAHGRPIGTRALRVIEAFLGDITSLPLRPPAPIRGVTYRQK